MTLISPTESVTAIESNAVWHRVGALTDLPVDRGVAALIGTEQVAIFRLAESSETDAVCAVSHLDPRTQVPVIARGLVGSVGDTVVVASPLYKERYDLKSGRCLDDDSLTLAVFTSRVDDGIVFVQGSARQ